ncbi:MAG: malate synthase [Clostridia bacterium]|nr:malate synthase [Clostridia bacterium]
MDLVDKQVTHEIFGKGRVVNYNDLHVKIDFPSGNKRFAFPDAFGTYLMLTDQKAADFMKKIVQERKREREEEAKRLEKMKAKQNIRQQRFLERERLAKKRRTRRIHPCSQSVFWCDAQELDEVFNEWNVFTGVIKSGQREGEPRRLARVSHNTACLLTVRNRGEAEKNRRIVGLFMVSENISSRRGARGDIPAHTEHRIQLTEQESNEMLFWNYYVNKKYPKRTTWNTGRHRYFDNIWTAQILKDILALKKSQEEQEQVEKFIEYFCKMNRIKKEDITEPNGALKR